MAQDSNNETDDFIASTVGTEELPGKKTPDTTQQGGAGGQNNGGQGAGKQGTQGGTDGSQQGGTQGSGTNQAENEEEEEEEEGQQGGQQNNGNDEPKAVEIDGKEYRLDDKGNALGADGKVFKTAEELAALTGGEEETTAIEDFFKLTGARPPLDENGQPRSYEDSLPGLLQAAIDFGQSQGRAAFEAMSNSSPHVKKYYDYLKRGGDPKEYHKQVASSWKEVKFDKKNTDMLNNVVVAQLMSTGMKEDKAKLTAKMYADTNNLESIAEEAYGTLVANETAREEAEMREHQQRVQAHKENEKKYWTEVETTVKSGKLKNITIPENEKPSFFKYIAEAVNKDGYSQADIDESNLTTQESLELRYLLFKKLDLSKLITTKAATQRASGLKQRFAGGQQGAGNGAGINTKKFKQSGNNLDSLTTDHVMT